MILLRSANAKPYFFLNEMNQKDLPAMYSTAFWCLFVVLPVFLALLRNHCYSFHRMRAIPALVICYCDLGMLWNFLCSI